MRVLVVEWHRLVAEPLRRAGLDVARASSPEQALAMAHSVVYDAIVVEPAPSEATTFATCTDLRRANVTTPILLLFEGNSAENRIKGLDAGADDCISAPYAFLELFARIRAVVRRVPAVGIVSQPSTTLPGPTD